MQRTLIDPAADMRWLGCYRTPDGDGSAAGPSGTSSFGYGALAVRYVAGERRLLLANFSNGYADCRQFGDLVEYREPAAARYGGPSHHDAPALVEVRRWADWTCYGSNVAAWRDPSGVRVGALYWDPDRCVLWYQLYGYYSGRNTPFLGATQLLDAVDTGTYCQLGTKYGPWWYRSNTPGSGAPPYWKRVCNGIFDVPASARADLGCRKVAMIAGVGSVGGAGHIGPGVTAFADLPSLSDQPNAVLPQGLRLADYTADGGSPARPPWARRNADYDFVSYPGHTSPDTGLSPSAGGLGYWQMSMDQIAGCAWVETATRHGLLIWGRQVGGHTAYGWNPLSHTPEWTPGAADFTDPSRPYPNNTNGYMGETWSGVIYAFDPDQVLQVGRGERSCFSDGINPAVVGSWESLWPNHPRDQVPAGVGATQTRRLSSTVSNCMFWDGAAGELLVVMPTSVSAANARPTVNYFSVA